VGTPRDQTARFYYRAANQRWDDAQFLLDAGRELAAVYIAGYAVECLLKALILTQVPAHERDRVLKSFRGGKAHDYDWLRDVYYRRGGSRFPPAVVQAFTVVGSWSVDLRYQPGTLDAEEADEFFAQARVVLDWAATRL
jgi:hypothetical protein